MARETLTVALGGLSLLPRSGQTQAGAAAGLRPSRAPDRRGRPAGRRRHGRLDRQSGSAVEWTTFDTGPLQERLFREAALGETTVDVGFILNTQAVPRTAELFEPLDAYLASDPIEDLPTSFPA